MSLGSGPLYALASAALFGASTPLAKLLLGGISPWLLAGLLYAGSGLGLFIWSALRSSKPRERIERRDLPYLAAAIAAGGVVGPVLLLAGLLRTSASAASLLLTLEGVFTIVIAWAVFREGFDRRILAGAILIVAGSLVLSWQETPGSSDFVGPILIAAACLAWALDNNLTRKVALSDPVRIAMLKGLVAGAVNLALAFSLGATVPDALPAFAGLAVGFLGYGVSLVLFVLALRNIGSARTGAYFAAAPLAGAIVAFALGDSFTAQFAGAAILIGAGVWLHLTEQHMHEHDHHEAQHTHSHVHDDHHQHAHGPDDPPVADRPHVHPHAHVRLRHAHAHFPDAHHDHAH